MASVKNLSILIISPHPSALGGVVAFIETVKKNLTLSQVTSFYVGSRTEEKEPLTTKVFRTLTMLCDFIPLMRKHRFDVVHINPSFTTHSILRDGLLLLVLRLMGFKKALVYFHGWNKQLASRVQRTFLFRALFVWLMGAARYVLVLSPEFKQSLMDMGIREDHIVCTRTLFDGSEFEDSCEERGTSDDHAKRGGSAQRPGGEASLAPSYNILFMARFDARKGIYELLEAFTRIAKDYPDATLTFAGDGAENGHLREKVKACGFSKRITFTGYVRDKEKIKLLHDCTVFVLPSYTAEGMPVALLEAMAAGKPVLVSNAGGIPHIIREPQNGIVLNHVTVENIEAALRTLLSDEAYCTKTGTHNKEYAWKHFEAKIVTAEMEKLYDAIAQS